MTLGVLLVNLGTPASTDVADVRAYLRDFLTDPYVIDLPWVFRQLVVRAFILPTRPRRSAEAYAHIWDAAGPGTGSPLLHYGERLVEALRARMPEVPCELAMRYGEPGLERGIRALVDRGVSDIRLLSLYPQHADSTRETTLRAVRERLPDGVRLSVQPPFFDDPAYLNAQAAVIRRHLPERWDHVLLSYHGLPERHLTRADPTGSHCLATPDCCERSSPAHATCYRHQVRATSRALAARLGIGTDRWSESYQSRLGRLPWLAPYTDEVLKGLPERGVKHLVVACPAFVADNLETLEEIGITGRDQFLDAGGESFTLIPCLNDDPAWVEVIAGWCTADQTEAARSDTAR
ncbi:MAG: ferrochelatase [Pseudomonadales bacterium]